MTKETKMKMPLMLRFIRWAFPKVERVAPSMAAKWAWKLFFTPFRFPVPAKEQELADQSNKFTFEAEGYTIQGYEWGTGEKSIFLMHGWSGRATQWRSFISLLNDKGYRVVAIDGPGHGLSSGGMTDIIRFQRILQVLFGMYPKMDSAITHSFGGASTMFAIQNGLKIRRLVNIGTPTDADYIIADFLRRINASAKSGEQFRLNVQKIFGQTFDYFSVKETVKFANNTDILMIHDRQDREVPVEHSIEVHEDNPDTQLILTEGLGHMRILRDAEVIAKAISFVEEPNTVISTY